jgi:hypothetical protein
MLMQWACLSNGLIEALFSSISPLMAEQSGKLVRTCYYYQEFAENEFCWNVGKAIPMNFRNSVVTPGRFRLVFLQLPLPTIPGTTSQVPRITKVTCATMAFS